MDERRRQYEDIEQRPPLHPQGRISNQMDPRQLPPGTPNMLNIDVMSSDGVSTITGPPETGLMDLYTPTHASEQDAVDGGREGFDADPGASEDHNNIMGTSDDVYDDEGMPLGEDYDYGHTINDAEYPVRRPPNTGGLAYSHPDDDPHEAFAEEHDHPAQSPPRNSFGRNDYNARVDNWTAVMQQTAVTQNGSSVRIANPERPQGASPHRPPYAQSGGNSRPPMNNSATTRPPMAPHPSRPQPQQAMPVQNSQDSGDLRICWLVLATLVCVIVLIGAVGAGLFLFTDLLDFQSSDDVQPTMAPSLAFNRDGDTGSSEPLSPTISPAPTKSPSPTMMPVFPSSKPSSEPTTALPTSLPSSSPSNSPTTTKEWQISAGPFQSSDVGTLFGKAVAIVDDFLVIGEPEFGASGDVTIIQRSNIFGNVVHNISALGAVELGFALDSAVVSGSPSIVIGARNTRNDLDGTISPTRFGTAYVFEYDSDTSQWVQVGDVIWPQLIFIEAAAEFGAAVCMASTSTSRRISVGAPSSSDFSTSNGGRVYTFEYDGLTWNMIGATLRGSRDEMLLGSSMDMSDDGDFLLVGAPGDAGGDGAAFYYQWDGSSWVEILEVTGDQGSLEGLGTSVAIVSNDVIAVGSFNYTLDEGAEGRIVIYRRSKTDSSVYEHMTDFFGSPGDFVGRTLSSKNGLIAFGTQRSFQVFRLTDSGDDLVEVPPLGGPIFDEEVVSISIADDGITVAVGLGTEDVLLYELTTVP